MINARRYQAWYRQLGLTPTQKQMLEEMIQAMMDRLARPASVAPGPGDPGYWPGRMAGLNSAFRLITGTLDEHDEFDPIGTSDPQEPQSCPSLSQVVAYIRLVQAQLEDVLSRYPEHVYFKGAARYVRWLGDDIERSGLQDQPSVPIPDLLKVTVAPQLATEPEPPPQPWGPGRPRTEAGGGDGSLTGEYRDPRNGPSWTVDAGKEHGVRFRYAHQDVGVDLHLSDEDALHIGRAIARKSRWQAPSAPKGADPQRDQAGCDHPYGEPDFASADEDVLRLDVSWRDRNLRRCYQALRTEGPSALSAFEKRQLVARILVPIQRYATTFDEGSVDRDLLDHILASIEQEYTSGAPMADVASSEPPPTRLVDVVKALEDIDGAANDVSAAHMVETLRGRLAELRPASRAGRVLVELVRDALLLTPVRKDRSRMALRSAISSLHGRPSFLDVEDLRKLLIQDGYSIHGPQKDPLWSAVGGSHGPWPPLLSVSAELPEGGTSPFSDRYNALFRRATETLQMPPGAAHDYACRRLSKESVDAPLDPET